MLIETKTAIILRDCLQTYQICYVIGQIIRYQNGCRKLVS